MVVEAIPSIASTTAAVPDLPPARVVFEVRDRKVLLAALDRRADLDREADLPAPVWTWTEPGEESREEPRRTLGSIRLRGRRLVLEAMSRPRDLLKSLERDQAHAARRGEPAYDVGWIWEELGLERP